MEENSTVEMEMVQIKGVDSTKRDTKASLAAGAKLIVTERLLTHGKQEALSNIEVRLNGADSSAQIISRTVAKDSSKQVFYYNAVGNDKCRAHVQCDSIIMDNATVSSIPGITANSAYAQIIHEAAIGRINNDQLVKLMTFGLTEEEAEEIIISGFLK
jgi:Fe-S cluster assembly scaffold protein SufB